MLFYGNLHKGNFIKEIFTGSFTEYKTNSERNQILCVSEKSIDLYEYSFDSALNMSFLEPILSQDLFIHIFNSKIITDYQGEMQKDILILITSCGLLAFSFNQENKLFISVGSCVLNLDCEEKDQFMYIKADSRYKYI